MKGNLALYLVHSTCAPNFGEGQVCSPPSLVAFRLEGRRKEETQIGRK
jgi:hypothetical protein